MNAIIRKTATIALALGFSTGPPAFAGIVTLTMDEVPTQLIDGLTVNKGGEAFTFVDPAHGLLYNSNGPGNITFVQDPSIQGSIDKFQVLFSQPVDQIQFGFAENILTAVTGAGTVFPFDATGFVGPGIVLNLSLVDPVAEGQFSYSGAPVTGFTFSPGISGASLMAFDNLRVNVVNVAAVPEPATLALLGIALTGIAFSRRKRA